MEPPRAHRLTTGMTTAPFVVLTSAAALAVAAAGGMMYVFSTFVMRGLDRTGPVDALTAMRGINTAANTSATFLLAYFGATVLSIVVGVMAALRLGEPGSIWVLTGAVFGILGGVITMVFNVPLNNHLGVVDPAAVSFADAAREWQAYYSTWTAWNHVRTATSVIAAALMAVGLRYS